LDRNLSYFRQALKGEIKYYHLEKRFIHKNGHIIWTNLSSSVVRDTKGNPLYFTTQIQDITKIKQANEAIEYDKLKTEFFANLSHELRTPLNVILASIQLSELHIKKGSEISINNLRKYIHIIKQNCLRLLRLVNNLIDVTKIDAGFQELHLEPTDIVNLIEVITDSVAEYAKGKGITVQYYTDIEEKVISIDPDKIERIVLNLLSNAIKFTDSNGNIFVNVHDKGDNILISVRDTGIGIPPDKQEIIFQRFRQVEHTLTKTHEGSGIGLSLVKSLVEMHGGKIYVNSEVGAGSEFVIELPAKQALENKNWKVSNYYNSDRVEKINIEFSDIYMQK
jgi:signal transduction histidine kinase